MEATPNANEPAPPQAPPAPSNPTIPTPPPEAPPPATPSAVPAATNASDGFYERVFGLATVAVLGWMLYSIISPFMGSIMWGLFLAFMLSPLHARMTGRFKGRESLSAAVLTFGTLLVLLGPLTALGAALVAQTSDLVAWLQSTVAQSTGGAPQTLADLPLVGPTVRWLHDRFGLNASEIQKWIADNAQHVPAMLAGLSGKIFLGALNTALSLVLMLFFLFFFIRDGHQLVAMLRDLIPIAPERREQLVDHMSAVTRAVVFGSGITALVQGALVGLAFLITGLTSPLVFGMLAAFLALMPAGGTALVWIPAVFVLVARDQWGMAIVMLVFGVVSSSIDNVLRPMLISGRVDVGTLTVFLGVLGGAAAFGLIGLFLGPVVLALIVALMNFARDQRKAA